MKERMPEESTIIQHRLPSEGADYLLLAGVNDANLQELARQTGCRVILRGDYLILSGELADVERAIPVAQQLIDMARLQTPFGVDDVRRIAGSMGPAAGRGRAAHRPGRRNPAPRRTARRPGNGPLGATICGSCCRGCAR
jgi:hypothetical protein